MQDRHRAERSTVGSASRKVSDQMSVKGERSVVGSQVVKEGVDAAAAQLAGGQLPQIRVVAGAQAALQHLRPEQPGDEGAEPQAGPDVVEDVMEGGDRGGAEPHLPGDRAVAL